MTEATDSSGPDRITGQRWLSATGPAPTAAPLGGFAIRNDVVRGVHGQAAAVAPDLVTDEHLDALVNSGRKLEVVLGRLWRTVGDQALGCLFALHVAVPNESHLLSAPHLANGGVHVTVNLKVQCSSR